MSIRISDFEFTHDIERQESMERPLVSEEKVREIQTQKELEKYSTLELIKAIELRGHILDIDKPLARERLD